jgi:DNA repair protein RecO (recombination protein O)
VESLPVEAILLRSVDFGESDQIVHLLTPSQGRLTAMAKGARRSVKRFPGTLDLLNLLEVRVKPPRRGMAYLEQATLVTPFARLRSNPIRFGLSCYLIELLDRLAPEGGSGREVVKLFEYTRDMLTALETAQPDPRLRVLLELRTLDVVGLRPELRDCVRCGEAAVGETSVAFHIPDGGVLCPACALGAESTLNVSPGTLRILDQALKFELEGLGRLNMGSRALAEAGLLLHRFQRFHVGIELRSARFLDEILAVPPPGSP